jgi:hypothetical protein
LDKKKLDPVNLGSIARGAAMEIFEIEIAKIAANIADPNTKAVKKRKLTLEFTFAPDTDRRAIDVTTSSKTSLAGVSEHASRVYLGKDSDGNPYILDQDPRQEMLFDPPPRNENLVDFKDLASGSSN